MLHTVQQIIQDNFEIIELRNQKYTAKIAVNIGNTLFSFKKDEKEKLYFPFSLETYKSTAKLAGNPFMHPWANRLEAEYIMIDTQKHHFSHEQLHLIYRDGNHLPLHGLLLKSDKWKTIELKEGENDCSHIAEFQFDTEDLLSVFPFRHTIQIKHHLQNNELKIETTLINNDEKEMPVSFGYHPYFLKTNEHTTLKIPASNVMKVNERMIPTGNSIQKENKWNFAEDTVSLKGNAFDDGFQDLKLNEHEEAIFIIETNSTERIKLHFDKNYPFAQIYAPPAPEKPYVCIEPMTAATNALNTNGCKKIKNKEIFTAGFSIVSENESLIKTSPEKLIAL